MRTRYVAVCLLLLGLVGLPVFGQAADKRTDAWAQFKAAKALEGWVEVSPGVLERKLGPTKVEHLGLGREGLSWLISDLGRQLLAMQREYVKYPSAQLDRAINDLIGVISRAHSSLHTMPEGTTSALQNVIGPSCSSICYSATADAYYLTSSQGVAAVAGATFNSSCGYSGETYAYAYARATSGTTTTTITQQDPKTGNPITSSASATVNGGSVAGIPCYSEASSYAQSSALGIAYSTSDTNTLCPVPPNPLAVTISGTSYEYFTTLGCRSRTWTSSVTGGTAPYTYQWKYNGSNVATTSSYTRSVCPSAGSFTLTLTVTDSLGATATDTHDVIVEYEPACCGCYAPICP